MPLSDRTVLSLVHWLRVRPAGRGMFLFPGLKAGRSISASTARAVVRNAAMSAFPRPDQEALRRRIYATGFRHLFIMRAIRARLSLGNLRFLTNVDRFSRLEP